MRPFAIALQFLTRLPVRLQGPYGAEELGRSLLWYPAVGLVIGALLAAQAWLLEGRGGLVPAALVLAVWIALTGALHLDGLADSTDAWAGGLGDRERSLAIMKDPRCGPAAVVMVVALLLVKFAGLAQLMADGERVWLILVPVLGRGAALWLLLVTPYARPGGLGDEPSRHLPRRTAAVVIGLVGTAAAAALGWPALPVLAACCACGWALRQLMLRRIGGTTGDTAGALVEITEAVALATASML